MRLRILLVSKTKIGGNKKNSPEFAGHTKYSYGATLWL